MRSRENTSAHCFVHSFAVARNFALSSRNCYHRQKRACERTHNDAKRTWWTRLTAAISGSNGSSGLGLFTFSLMTASTAGR